MGTTTQITTWSSLDNGLGLMSAFIGIALLTLAMSVLVGVVGKSSK